VGAAMMVVIRQIWAVREGRIRKKKSGHSPGGVATGMGVAGFVRAVRDSQNRGGKKGLLPGSVAMGTARTKEKKRPLTKGVTETGAARFIRARDVNREKICHSPSMEWGGTGRPRKKSNLKKSEQSVKKVRDGGDPLGIAVAVIQSTVFAAMELGQAHQKK